MAIDLEPRKTSSKPEANLQRKFADLCARVKRVDLIAAMLAVALAVAGYALLIGWFDWFAGNSGAASVSAFRWLAFAGFLGLFFFLVVQAGRCLFRCVNPYYVAHRLEQTVPGAKNSLINWLDLHEQGLPTAFQRHLSTRAANHFNEMDKEQTLPKRKNWIMLGTLAAPTLGLLILLLLGPSAFLASMLRAFIPFYTPPEIALTRITLLQPEGGDAEVSPTQAIAFTAKIEGRVPAAGRPDAPRLLYRYQANEDYFTLPLKSEGAGIWGAQLAAEQLHTGFSYKISAADAETPEHQVRIRARPHVAKFEITYHYRPYRKLPKKTVAFTDKTDAVPTIHGVRGTEVEVVVHASRPVKDPRIDIELNNGKKQTPAAIVGNDPHTFVARWTLEQSGRFRVSFTSADGEENTDRRDYDIQVRDDEAPTVALTNPGKDVSIPENGILEIEGKASDDIGIKGLTLHLRLLNRPDKLQPKAYRPDTSFKLDDGTYPDLIDYMDFLALDQLKNENGTTILPGPGAALEYWLEATDNADYPSPNGNVGKSAAFKITLTAAIKDQSQVKKQRANAAANAKTHSQKQDKQQAKKNNERNNKNDQNGPGGPPNLQDEIAKKEKENSEEKKKLDDAMNDQKKDQKTGAAKGNEQNPADKKDGPPDANGPKPESKQSPPMPSEKGGDKKDQGDGQGDPGEAKDGGGDGKKDNAANGEPKAGPKEPQGGAKDGGPMAKPGPMGETKDSGPMGMNTPTPKEQAADGAGPMPQAKQQPQADQPGDKKADAKGAEQNGPDTANKDQQTAQAPMPTAKGDKMNEPDMNNAEPKQGPPEQAKDAGKTRGDEVGKNGPPFDDILKNLKDLPKPGKEGDDAGKALAAIGKQTDDPAKAELARDILAKNGRDPGTGLEKKKGPHTTGSLGQTEGISDQVKAAAANREFARRIGQMQLEDWKKNVTPEVLKKAGMSEADFQRFVKNMQSYDSLVRQWNDQLAKKQMKELRGSGAPLSKGGPRAVEGTGTDGDPLDGRHAPPPRELRAVQERFTRP